MQSDFALRHSEAFLCIYNINKYNSVHIRTVRLSMCNVNVLVQTVYYNNL